MLIVINYADKNFLKAQKFNTKTAYKNGKVDKVIEYSPNDIDKSFYNKHYDVLKEKRGGGYWLWKPYIILKTMNCAKEGDYIFYCDSGAYFINKVEYLTQLLELSEQDMMVFELPLMEKQWTKSFTFEYMNCNNDLFKDTNQILSGYILLKVNNSTRKFFEEFLSLCKVKEIVSDINNSEKDEDLIAHRHDQSIFSLLCKKYNLETFRDPSQYGIRPWEYLAEGRIYNPKVYSNSNYPQILVSQRKANIYTFRVKDFIKRQLTKLGILNENQFRRKNNIFL